MQQQQQQLKCTPIDDTTHQTSKAHWHIIVQSYREYYFSFLSNTPQGYLERIPPDLKKKVPRTLVQLPPFREKKCPFLSRRNSV